MKNNHDHVNLIQTEKQIHTLLHHNPLRSINKIPSCFSLTSLSVSNGINEVLVLVNGLSGAKICKQVASLQKCYVNNWLNFVIGLCNLSLTYNVCIYIGWFKKNNAPRFKSHCLSSRLIAMSFGVRLLNDHRITKQQHNLSRQDRRLFSMSFGIYRLYVFLTDNLKI